MRTKTTSPAVKAALDNIKALRAIKGYSQEHVAKILDMDYSTYGKIENGHSKITLERLCEIAAIFKVSVYSLLNGYHSEEPKTNDPLASITDNNTIKINLEIPLSLLQEKLKK